jgi:predicted FMN-binding regulatory protein PaiB
MILKSDILQMLSEIHNDLEELEKTIDFKLADTEADMLKQQQKSLWKTENRYYILEGKFNLAQNSSNDREDKRTTA